jgi:hypothetical protein
MSLSRDVRRHRRELLRARIQLVWADAGGLDHRAVGRCRDVSISGLRLEVDQPIPLRTLVTFRVESPAFEGSATVRHCTRVGFGWVCGLEFSCGLRWRFASPAAAGGKQDQDERVA